MTNRHKGLIIGLLITLSACTVAHRAWGVPRHARSPAAAAAGVRQAKGLDVARLVRAIAHVESGGRNCKPKWDVNGMAWGLYQFHLPRWIEVGGTRENFGRASPALQTKLMRQAMRKRRFATFEAVARWHNGAGSAHYAYAKRLEAAYRPAHSLPIR